MWTIIFNHFNVVHTSHTLPSRCGGVFIEISMLCNAIWSAIIDIDNIQFPVSRKISFCTERHWTKSIEIDTLCTIFSEY